jgi:hypothetical protein
MAKLSISKAFTKLLENGFTQADIDAAENHSVKRDFFLPSHITRVNGDKETLEKRVYGGASDPQGRWIADKVGTIIKEEGKPEKRVVAWAVVYEVNEGTAEAPNWVARESLSKSFLLTRSRIDVNGVAIAPKGDVRQWADKNILSGVLDKEWTAKLAEELNRRGLLLTAEEFRLARKADGKPFDVPFTHPHFADTYTF